MIEEVINSILQAEDVAKQRIAKAEQQAADAVNSAELAAEQSKKVSVAANKAYFAEQMNVADAEAKRQADEYLQQQKIVADAETEHYRRNVDKAVKIILESL